jgi:hypothetical protein
MLLTSIKYRMTIIVELDYVLKEAEKLKLVGAPIIWIVVTTSTRHFVSQLSDTAVSVTIFS